MYNSGVHIRKTVCSYGHRKHMTLGCIFKEFTNLRRNSRVDRLACNIGNFSPTSFLSWCWLTRHNLRLILRQEIKSERRRLLPRILIILLIHLTDKEHRNPSIRFGFFDSAPPLSNRKVIDVNFREAKRIGVQVDHKLVGPVILTPWNSPNSLPSIYRHRRQLLMNVFSLLVSLATTNLLHSIKENVGHWPLYNYLFEY